MPMRFLGWLVVALALNGGLLRAFPEYYTIPELDKAEAEAKERHLPLAWLGSGPETWLTMSNVTSDGGAGLTQMAMATLQGQAVVVYFDGKDMSPVPMVVHMQYHVHDDGELPGGISWIQPKIVFSNADLSKMLGRVSHTQLKAEGDAAIRSALLEIQHDPTALDLGAANPAAPETSAPNPVAAATPPTANATWNWIAANGIYFALALAVVVVIYAVAANRGTPGENEPPEK